MTEVLKKVTELVDVLQLRIRKYEDAAREADKVLGEANTLKATNEERAKALDEREKTVLDRENRVGEIESLQALREQVTGAKTALAVDQETFAKEQTDARKTLDDDQKAVAAARDKLAARELKLDEDRRTYKSKVMQQLIDAGWSGPKVDE